jgi:Zn-dependent protease with chaperone function
MKAVRPISNRVPPWLWFWLLTFALSLPYYIAVWQRNWNELFIPLPPTEDQSLGNQVSFRVLGLMGLTELIPSAAIVLGVLALLLPRLRTQKLAQTYDLKPVSDENPLPEPLLTFLKEQAPGLTPTANLTRFDQTAFVYPLGFNQTGIAIFGPVIKLWYRDQAAAEAILLHEIAHYRHGDALVVGAGSPFRFVIEHWLKLYRWLFILPITVAVLALLAQFVVELFWMRITLGQWLEAIGHKVGQTLFLSIAFIFATFWLFLWITCLFLPPMVAIWTCELNADQSPATRSQADILKALQGMPDKNQRRKWLFSRLAHPPHRLRLWMVAHAHKPYAQVLLLLLFPLTYGLQMLVLRVWAWLPAQMGTLVVPVEYIANLRLLAWFWLSSAVLLAGWPYLAGYWEQLFCRGDWPTRPEKLPYWISAGILMVLGLAAFSQVA